MCSLKFERLPEDTSVHDPENVLGFASVAAVEAQKARKERLI